MLTIEDTLAALTEEVLRLSLMVGHIRLQLGMVTKEDMKLDVDAVAQNFGMTTDWSNDDV